MADFPELIFSGTDRKSSTPISIKVTYSQPEIPKRVEEQLFYILLEFSPSGPEIKKENSLNLVLVFRSIYIYARKQIRNGKVEYYLAYPSIKSR